MSGYVDPEKQKLYRDLFESDDGKKVLEDLKVFCNYDSPSFVPGCSDSTAFNEGKRRVVLRILSFIESNYKPKEREAYLTDIMDGIRDSNLHDEIW